VREVDDVVSDPQEVSARHGCPALSALCAGQPNTDLTGDSHRLSVGTHPDSGHTCSGGNHGRVVSVHNLLLENHTGAAEGVSPSPHDECVSALGFCDIVDLDTYHEDPPIAVVEYGPREPGLLKSFEAAMLQIVQEDGMIHMTEGVQLRATHVDHRFGAGDAWGLRTHGGKEGRSGDRSKVRR